MLRFVHISDTHLGPDADHVRYGRNTYQDAKAMVDFINHDLEFEPDFVLHTGDVINEPDDGASSLAAGLFRTLRFPTYYVLGNHDDRDRMRADLLGQAPVAGPLSLRLPPSRIFIFWCWIHAARLIRRDSSAMINWIGWPRRVVHQMHSRWRFLCIICPFYTGVTWIDRDMRIMNDDAFFAVLKPHRERLRGVFFRAHSPGVYGLS